MPNIDYKLIFEVFREYLAYSERYREVCNKMQDLSDNGYLPEKFSTTFQPTQDNLNEFFQVINDLNDQGVVDISSASLMTFYYSIFQDIENESIEQFWSRVKNYIFDHIEINRNVLRRGNMELAYRSLFDEMLNFYLLDYDQNNDDEQSIENFIFQFSRYFNKHLLPYYYKLDDIIININSCNLYLSDIEKNLMLNLKNFKRQVLQLRLFPPHEIIITDINVSTISDLSEKLYRVQKCNQIKAERKKNKQLYGDDVVLSDFLNIYFPNAKSLPNPNLPRDRKDVKTILNHVESGVFPGNYTPKESIENQSFEIQFNLKNK